MGSSELPEPELTEDKITKMLPLLSPAYTIQWFPTFLVCDPFKKKPVALCLLAVMSSTKERFL